jgi:hypothetical protein
MCPCRTPLYLLETTRGAAKATSWTEAIAARLGVPAFAVYYTTTPEQLCITCKRPAPVELLTLQAFQVYPQPRHCVGDADAFAAVLLQLRAEHNVRAHDRRAG